MKELMLMLLMFGMLLLLEMKPLNILFNFIGMMLTMSMILILNQLEYLGFLMMIMYSSALTIMFGFVMMLFPLKNNLMKMLTSHNKLLNNNGFKIFNGFYFILFLGLMGALFEMMAVNKLFVHLDVSDISFIKDLLNNLNNYKNYLFEFSNLSLMENSNSFTEWNSNDSNQLNKMGYLLYFNTENIFKLLLSMTILLLSLFILFFMF